VTGPIVEDNGFKYIAVFIDAFSQYVYLFAIPDQTAQTLCKCLIKVIADQGLMSVIVSDNGAGYIASMT